MSALLEAQVIHRKQTIQLRLLAGGLMLTFAGKPREPQLVSVPQIQAQFVNSPESPKALLRVTTTDEQVLLFQFQSHAERDGFKDALAQLLSQYRATGEWDSASMAAATQQISGGGNSATPAVSPPKLSKEDIKIRQNLLANDPSLRRLHRDLVMAGHFTEEEFWQPRQHLLRIQKEQNAQEVGLSSELLHEPQPTAASTTADIKYTLTPQIIRAIFIHHPKLQRAYEDNVPDKISEKEFWTRCFQSAFFYRDRQQFQKSKDALFDTIAAEEQNELDQPIRKNLLDFLTDVEMVMPDVSEDYGNAPDVTMKPGQSKQSISIIRKLNRHGELVLSADEKVAKRSKIQETGMDVDDPALPRHKQVLRDVMVIKELQPPSLPPIVPLNIRSKDSFFEGQTPSQPKLQQNSQSDAVQTVISGLKNWSQSTKENPISTEACAAFLEEQISIMAGQKVIPTRPPIPADSFQDFKAIHITTTELLRHFWLAHLSTLPQDQSKCNRIVATMKKVRERILNWKVDAERQAIDVSAAVPCQQMAESLLKNVDKVLEAGR